MEETVHNSADYEVKLEIFEGPLDLLIHLIRKNEVDIFDIPIAVITDQYLQYLDLMKALNVSLAGDFLVMASTLVHIKSRMLLPGGEEGEEEDPRNEITRPLLEYMRLKELANELSERPLLGRDVFARLSSSDDASSQFEGEEPLLRVNLFQLMDAFKKVLEQRVPAVQIHFQMEQWSVKERMNHIIESLKTGKTRTFADLFAQDRTLSQLVATFLALLELVQMGLLRVFQTGVLSDIQLELTVNEEQEDV